MRLRTIKKLSKRAAPYLPLLGDKRGQFPAEKEDGELGTVIDDHRDWERSPCHPNCKSYEGAVVRRARAGHTYIMRRPWHPLKGTIMVGSVEGYYEPEWSDETAWDALRRIVFCEFTDWATAAKTGGVPEMTRTFRSHRDIFAAADDLLRERQGNE